MQVDNRKRKHMLVMIQQLLRYPEWQHYRAYLNEQVDEHLLDMEMANDEKRAYITLGKIKFTRELLQMDENAINILLDSTPDDGPVGAN